MTIGAWRPLRKNDLAQVVEIAAATFPDHPEDAACFEGRIATSRWCLGLDDGEGGLDGYLVAYPWPLGDIPPLNTLLGPVRDAGGALFLHDLALRPVTAGRGYAHAAVESLARAARADGLTDIALVSVNGTAEFWKKVGFHVERLGQAMGNKLATYGDGARYMRRNLQVLS